MVGDVSWVRYNRPHDRHNQTCRRKGEQNCVEHGLILLVLNFLFVGGPCRVERHLAEIHGNRGMQIELQKTFTLDMIQSNAREKAACKLVLTAV